jgi:hypothetical protein
MRRIVFILRAPRVSSAILCVAAAFATGCAGVPLADRLGAPPDESVRAQLGRVAVVAAAADPVGSLEPPITGPAAGAARGALTGAFIGFSLFGSLMRDVRMGGGSGGGELMVLFFLFITFIAASLIPIGAAFGALWGAAEAPAGAKFEADLRDLRQAAIVERVHAGIADDLRRLASSSDDVAMADADTTLEIGAPRLVFTGPWQFDPPLRLRLDVPFRLVRMRDGATLYEAAHSIEGPSMKFAEWAADKGAALRGALSGLRRPAAREIDEHLHRRVLLPVDRPPVRRKP